MFMSRGERYAKFWLEPIEPAESRISAPLEWFPRLLQATPVQRAKWRLIGRGLGIHWYDVDEDVSVRSLLAS